MPKRNPRDLEVLIVTVKGAVCKTVPIKVDERQGLGHARPVDERQGLGHARQARRLSP